jgi:hypothetical protein
VNEKVHCPLFLHTPSLKNVEELLTIVKSVAVFRKHQAAEKREKDGREKEAIEAKAKSNAV